MSRFFIQRVRFRPAGEERPDTPHAGYECLISQFDVTEDPAVVHVRYEQLQPLLTLWKCELPIELARHQFDAPERCRDPKDAFEYLLDLVNRQIDPELIQPGWYLAHVAQALADLRCPRFDAVQLAGSKRYFAGAFDADGELSQTWLATLAAEVHRRSSGIVTLEEADATEFVTNPPKPVAYLVVSRGDERLWCILRPWPEGIPLVTDDDLAHEGAERRSSHDASLEAQLIALYNEQYAKIFASARSKGADRAEALQRDAGAFFSGSPGLADLYRGLSFGADGTIDPDAMLVNYERMTSYLPSRRFEILSQGLSEILDLLLFSASESMDSAIQRTLERSIQELLRERGEGSGDVLPPDPVNLIEEFTVGEPDDPASSLSVLDLEEIAMTPEPHRLTLEELNALARLAPRHGSVPPPTTPSRPFIMDQSPVPVAPMVLAAFSAAESEAKFAIEQLTELARSVELPDTERELVLRSLEHIRATLRELAKARDALFPLPSARRR